MSATSARNPVSIRCRQHGGIGDASHCPTCHADGPPPGERATDELTASDSIVAMHDALVTISQPADANFKIRTMEFRRLGKWIVLHVNGTDGTTVIDFDVRMPRERAQVLVRRLNAVLGT